MFRTRSASVTTGAVNVFTVPSSVGAREVVGMVVTEQGGTANALTLVAYLGGTALATLVVNLAANETKVLTYNGPPLLSVPGSGSLVATAAVATIALTYTFRDVA